MNNLNNGLFAGFIFCSEIGIFPTAQARDEWVNGKDWPSLGDPIAAEGRIALTAGDVREIIHFTQNSRFDDDILFLINNYSEKDNLLDGVKWLCVN